MLKFNRMRLLTLLLTFLAVAPAADRKPVYAPGPKPVGPYTPGITGDGFLYVSGQGARDAGGSLPASPEAQVKQTLENVRAVLQAQGLTMDHVVYAQAYLADMKNYATLNKVWAQYFPKNPPARSVIGVTRMPTETPVEISAVAVVDLKRKKPLKPVPGDAFRVPRSVAVDVGDRVYVSGELMAASAPKDPRAQVESIGKLTDRVLKQAGLDNRNFVAANVYVGPDMPLQVLAELMQDILPDESARTVLQTANLPDGMLIQVSGVAARSAERQGGHCRMVSTTIYCSGRVGTTRQALASLKADLEIAGAKMAEVVAVNVYMDDLDQFTAMNSIYATYFPAPPPTRTTVQPWKMVADLALPPTTGVGPQKDDSPRVQISLVGVR